MTNRFPEDYAKPRLEKIGGELLKGWAACPDNGASPGTLPNDCNTGSRPAESGLFNPSILGEGL